LLFYVQQGNCPGSCYYNVYVWQPQSLTDQSTGICSKENNACATALQKADLVRSSQTQLITFNKANIICNKYVDAFFTKIHRAPYQRDVNMNNTVANVLAGCTDDLVFTGQIEVCNIE